MSRQDPGFQRPVLDKSVHSDVHKAVRNIYDNLSNLKSKTDQNTAAIAATGEKAASKTAPTLESGVYTPVLFNSVNLDSSATYPAQWMRVDKVVTVSGRVDVNPTAAANTELGISIPVKTNLTFIYQLAGTAAAPEVASESAALVADTGNNRAKMQWIPVSTANHILFYTFTYLVN